MQAAEIDGAKKWQSFLYITVPHIKIVMGLLVVLRTVWIFNNFDIIYLITGGGQQVLRKLYQYMHTIWVGEQSYWDSHQQ